MRGEYIRKKNNKIIDFRLFIDAILITICTFYLLKLLDYSLFCHYYCTFQTKKSIFINSLYIIKNCHYYYTMIDTIIIFIIENYCRVMLR